MNIDLSPVIAVDEEKCLNCHSCISVCPVTFANNASGNVVDINKDRCIGCGQCLKACSHNARYGLDDMEYFLQSLRHNEDVVAIVAPAIAANFPDEYQNFNGWLHSLGVLATFDVSFGAELTIKSYLDHVEKNDPKTVIAQPCPALVNYIELYKPNLIPYLAPADSPMVHTIKMVKEFYPEYSHAKFAVISPCFAKKHEFEMTGEGDYNVTFASIISYMTDHNVQLRNYPEIDYINPKAERGVLFSTPGGLLRTARRWSDDIESITRKIEGPDQIYDYLDNLEGAIQSGSAPKIIDCLNCEQGCNGGTATIKQKELRDTLERNIEDRATNHIQHHKKEGFFARKREKKELEEVIQNYWKPNLYMRNYSNRSNMIETRTPSETELKNIFESMHKYSKKDIYNCVSCGYKSCKKMGEAIINGLNKPENCHHFLKKTTEMEQQHSLKQQEKIEEAHSEMQVIINRAKEQNLALTDGVKVILDDLLNTIAEQKSAFEEFMSEIKQTATVVDNFKPIARSIKDIAVETDLLSVNASIEAVRAGQYGKSFSVVAREVKMLAKNSKKEATKIEPYLEKLNETFENIHKKAEVTLKSSEKTTELSDKIRGLVDQIEETSHSFEDEFKM